MLKIHHIAAALALMGGIFGTGRHVDLKEDYPTGGPVSKAKPPMQFKTHDAELIAAAQAKRDRKAKRK